ncbi:MAG: hypothetical protein NUW22_12595 [Acidobacteria bacterium]|nr:hypothetical protein [Acidobacteriota bacterium]
MSSLVATNTFFWANGIDLSSYVTGVTFNRGSEGQDATTMGQTTRISKGGLKTWSFDVQFLWDNSTGGPEPTLWSLLGTTSCVEYRHQNACSSVNNPSYWGIASVLDLPQAAAVGAMLTVNAKFENAGTLSRASSS